MIGLGILRKFPEVSVFHMINKHCQIIKSEVGVMSRAGSYYSTQSHYTTNNLIFSPIEKLYTMYIKETSILRSTVYTLHKLYIKCTRGVYI